MFHLFAVVISCGGGSESSADKGEISHQGTTMGLSFPAPKFLRAAGISGLQCHAILDDGKKFKALDVDPDNGTVSGTIEDVSLGEHRLELKYFTSFSGNDIVLCTYSKILIVTADGPTTVTMMDNELNRNYDDDSDGITNLVEVENGTDPRDPLSLPNIYYLDDDEDGYGDPENSVNEPQDGYVLNNTDCDDSNTAIHPGADETCDGIDNNCNNTIDEGCPLTTWYRDNDGDEYGDPNDTLEQVNPPPGYVNVAGDCNDNEAAINPGIQDVCGDDIDQDCNSETCAPSLWYYDGDRDSFGDPDNTISRELKPDNYVSNNEDCNDEDDEIHPGADEIANNDIDEDCDGEDLIDPTTIDADGDGFTPAQGDCDDADKSIGPGAQDVCGDGIDQDCNGEDALCNRIPDTGQTTSYTDTFGEDSDYTINPQFYTKLDANGDYLSDSATAWAMVRDNVTGLIWENKTDDDTIHDRDNTFTWQLAQEVFIAQLNKTNFGGYNDWRLPSVKELASIVHSDKNGPAINIDFFTNTMSSNYWSSTTHAYSTDDAWNVSFSYGFINYDDKSISCNVRAVRGNQLSAGGFVDNGDGTISDIATGLMWQKGESDAMTWEQALVHCENATLAGYSNWRLPSRNELQSLVDYTYTDPAIDRTMFPNAMSSGYWSSTTHVYDTDYAWVVDFGNGYVGGLNKYSSYYVRAVRAGQ